MKKTATFKDTFKVKKAGDGSVVIEGWANKAVADRGGDLLTMESWDLNNFKKSGIMLFNHDRDKPIGKMIDVRATEQGLWIKGQISASKDPFVSYVRDLISEGILNAFSVGFEAKDEAKNADGINEIKSAELYEVSVVTLPMNQDSLFSLSSKSLKGLGYREVKNKVLKEKGALVAATLQQGIYDATKNGKMSTEEVMQMACEKAGCDPDMLKEVLSGNMTPVPEAILYALADTLGMDLDELKKLSVKESPEPETPAEEEKEPSEKPAEEEKPAEKEEPKEEETPKEEEKPAEEKTAEEKAEKPEVGVISILIPKDAVADVEAAAAWAAENGWASDKVEETEDGFVVHQDDPANYGAQTSMDLGDGVTAMVGVKGGEEKFAPGDQTPTDGIPDKEQDPQSVSAEEDEKSISTKEAIPASAGGEPDMSGNPHYEQARQTNVLLGALIEAVKEMSTKLDKVVVQSEEQEEYTEEQSPPQEEPAEDPGVAKMIHDANLKLDELRVKLQQYC